MAGGDSHEIWTRFVEANYLKDAITYEGKCPTCSSPKDCNNYYCLQCKVGGLCPTTFRAPGEHNRHPWLQVRRQSRQSAVDPEDLAQFIGHESTKHIQKCSLNNGSLCYLRTKAPEPNPNSSQLNNASASSAKRTKRPPVRKLKSCEGCRSSIANSQDCEEEFLVCSVQCLITVAQRQPEKNLLQMRDGAMDPTDVFPLTALEKINSKLNGRPGATSRAAAMVDPPGTASAGESVPTEPATRGSSGRRAAPVNYRELHRGGSDPATARGSRGAGGAGRRTASGVQAPDYSAYPLGYRCEGLQSLIAAAQATGDWDHYLGDLGRD